MIGNPDSSLFVELAKEYKPYCSKMLLISRYSGTQSNYTDDKISIVSTIESESKSFRIYLSLLARLLMLIVFFERLFSKKDNTISIIEPIIQSISVSRYVKKLKNVEFVVAHNVFTYGLAALKCDNHIRVMRPWGGDVYQYALKSKLNYRLSRKVLQQSDIVDAISPALYKYLQDEFKVGENLVLNAATTYMGAAETTKIKKHYTKEIVRKELGLPDNKTIILNSRRFKEKWGSEEVFKLFVKLADKYEETHFVLFSGSGSEEKIKEKKKILAEKNILSRFTLYEKNMDLLSYIKVVYSSDIFVSLMHEADLRSASIMSGLHCDSLPVISDQPEYHEMISEGAMMQIINYSDIDAAVLACEKYMFDEEFKQKTIKANREFISGQLKPEEHGAVLFQKIEELKEKEI